jgi:hypothetical protein
LALVLALAWSCTTYEYKAVPFKAAEAYPNRQEVYGAQFGAKAWLEAAEARTAFGFDIKGAGVTAVQVVVDHQGSQTLTLVPDQIFLLDDQDQYWELLPPQVALDRIEKHTRMGAVGKKGSTTAILGGAAGAILGAAYGIVSDRNVIDTAAKGAAAGAALGAVKGGADAADGDDNRDQIAGDLAGRELKGKPLSPQTISQGFLFFPGEVSSAKELRLKVRNEGTGEVQTLQLPLP